MKYSRFGAAVVLVSVLILAACGQKEGAEAEKQTQSPAERVAALDSGPRAAQTMKLDEDLADRGEVLFDEKSCLDCHTLGESDMSPDLLGVLDRRTKDWLMMQITQPDWMKEHDPITKGLIEQFDLDMIGTGVAQQDAEAILHFLLRESAAN